MGPAIFALAAFRIGDRAARPSALFRATGQLEDARVTAARLAAFATKLIRRDPTEAWFHVVLCVAREHESKNAWKVNDLATIEAATRNALVAASTALDLDPGNNEARFKVSILQDKLFGLAAPKRPSP